MLSASQYLSALQTVACQGPCGPRGACGPQGFQGNPGYSGPGGPIGYSGPLGPTGPVSTVLGYTGSIGIQGYTGSTGLQGYSGPRGYTGADGQAYTGATGPQGYTGPGSTVMGYTGSIGTQGYSGPMGYTGVMGPSYTVKGTWQPTVQNLVNGGTNITSANVNAAITTNSPLITNPPYTTAAVGDLVYISYPSVASSIFYCYTGGTISNYTAQWVFMGNLATTAIQGSTGVQGYTGASITGYTGVQGYTGIQGYSGPGGYTGPAGYTGPGSTVMGYTGSIGTQGYSGPMGYTGVMGPSYTVKGTWQPIVENLVNGGTNITSVNVNAAITTNSPLITNPPYTTAAVGDLVYISYPSVASSIFYCYTPGSISGNNAQWVFMGNLATTAIQGSTGVQGYTGASIRGYTGPDSTLPGPAGYTGPGSTVMGYTGSIGTQGYSGPMGYTGVMGPSYTVKGTWQPTVQNLVNGGTNITSANVNAAISTNSPLTTNPPYTTAAVGDLVYISYPSVASSIFYCYTGGTISNYTAQWVFMGNLATTAIQGSTGVQGYTGASITGYTGADSTVAGNRGYTGPAGYTGPGSTVMGYTGAIGSTYSNFVGAANCTYSNQSISTTATITTTTVNVDVILFTSGTLLAGCRLDYKIVLDSNSGGVYPQLFNNSGNYLWVSVGGGVINFNVNIGTNTILATSPYLAGDVVSMIADGNIGWFYKNGVYMTQCAFSGTSFTSKLTLSGATIIRTCSISNSLLSFYVSGVPGSQGFPTLSKAYTAVPPGMLYASNSIASLGGLQTYTIATTTSLINIPTGMTLVNGQRIAVLNGNGTLNSNSYWAVTNLTSTTFQLYSTIYYPTAPNTPPTNGAAGSSIGAGTDWPYQNLGYPFYTFNISMPTGLYMMRVYYQLSGITTYNAVTPMFFYDNVSNTISGLVVGSTYSSSDNTSLSISITAGNVFKFTNGTANLSKSWLNGSDSARVWYYQVYLLAKY